MSLQNIVEQIQGFEKTILDKEKEISSLNKQLSELTVQNKKLNDEMKTYKESIDGKIIVNNTQSQKELLQLKKTHDSEIALLKSQMQQMDQKRMYEMYEKEIGSLRNVYELSYKKTLAEQIEKERIEIQASMKEHYKKKFEKKKEELYAEFDLKKMSSDIKAIWGALQLHESSSYNENDMLKFIQLMNSNGNFQSYRVPNSGGVYQVVNGWFNMFKCPLPSFCKSWIYDVIREGQQASCSQTMIVTCKTSPYVEWMIQIGDIYSLCIYWMQNLKTIPPMEMMLKTSSNNVSSLCSTCIQQTHSIPPQIWRDAYRNDAQLKSWWSSYCPGEACPIA